jgi:predicted RNA-binding protein (virulence factor B family)
MSLTIDMLLGRNARLKVRRIEAPGAFLEIDDDPDGFCVLVPRAELQGELEAGDEITVFVYLDSSDRPIATTRSPALTLNEVTFLEVRDTTRFGAFVEWGLPKQLLVPFAEQTRELSVGERHPIGLLRDNSDRLIGTMRVRELLHEGGDFQIDEWVEGEAWRQEPGVGVFVILERRFVGLLPEREPHALRRGQAASFRIAHVWPDGKLALSLRGLAHDELAQDAERVLSVLQGARAPALSDRSPPEQIRTQFGLSKKAFKRAVGRLLKQGHVVIDAHGYVVPTVLAAKSPATTRPPRP